MTPAPEALQHHGMDEDDLPELGDLKGLTRLVRQAIGDIERMDLPDHEPQAWIVEIEAAFEAAAGRVALELQCRPIPRKSSARRFAADSGEIGVVCDCVARLSVP
jgi:hypothetical protein